MIGYKRNFLTNNQGILFSKTGNKHRMANCLQHTIRLVLHLWLCYDAFSYYADTNETNHIKI